MASGNKSAKRLGKTTPSGEESSESEEETEPAKSFHRRLSTNHDIKCSVCLCEIASFSHYCAAEQGQNDFLFILIPDLGRRGHWILKSSGPRELFRISLVVLEFLNLFIVEWLICCIAWLFHCCLHCLYLFLVFIFALPVCQSSMTYIKSFVIVPNDLLWHFNHTACFQSDTFS